MSTTFDQIMAAHFSDDRKYRHYLFRQWGLEGPLAGLIGKNPSIANEKDNDPTITREIAFAKSWGCRGLVKLNMYDYIATDSNELVRISDSLRVSDRNLVKHIIATLKDHQCNPVVCCWGTHANRRLKESILTRGDQIRRALIDAGIQPMCFTTNSDGTPKHPLYMSANTGLMAWASDKQGER